MSNLNDGLLQPDESTVYLHRQLEARLNKKAASGAVDVKTMHTLDRGTTTGDKLWTFNNVLRMMDEGQMDVQIIEN